MRPTIKDIARVVGVSPNTVSKALSGRGRVSQATRQRVAQAARDMNYMPNRSARALARRGLKVAAVYPVEPHEFYAHIARGIAHEAAAMADLRCAVSVHPYPSIETPTALRQTLTTVLAEKPDGLILTCSHRFEEYRDVVAKFAEAEIPIVYATIFGDMVPGVIGGVRTNTFAAGQVAANFLSLVIPARLGHRDGADQLRVAILVGAKQVLVYQECVDGFTAQAADTDIAVGPVLETFGRPDMAYEAAAQLFGGQDSVDGVYVASHNSVGLCQYLEDNGLAGRIPVIGHDLFPLLNQKLRSGALTATLYQSQFDQGRDAVRVMVEALDCGFVPAEPVIHLVEPRLVLPSMIRAFPDFV